MENSSLIVVDDDITSFIESIKSELKRLSTLCEEKIESLHEGNRTISSDKLSIIYYVVNSSEDLLELYMAVSCCEDNMSFFFKSII